LLIIRFERLLLKGFSVRLRNCSSTFITRVLLFSPTNPATSRQHSSQITKKNYRFEHCTPSALKLEKNDNSRPAHAYSFYSHFYWTMYIIIFIQIDIYIYYKGLQSAFVLLPRLSLSASLKFHFFRYDSDRSWKYPSTRTYWTFDVPTTARAFISCSKYLSCKYDTIFFLFLPISNIGIKPFFLFFSYPVRSAIGFRHRYGIFFLCSQFIAGHHSPGRRRYIVVDCAYIYVCVCVCTLLYMYTAPSHTHAHNTGLRRNQSFTISSHRQFSTKSIWIMCKRCGARRQYGEIERAREKRVTEREREREIEKIYM
jgi:hypothetical protein